MKNIILLFVLLGLFSVNLFSQSNSYNRLDWHYKSNLSLYEYAQKGYYTNISDQTNVDHVVSLHDAHHSGGASWSYQKKKKFTNDDINQVAALKEVNRNIKKNFTPKNFIKRMEESKYKFYQDRKCEYVLKYVRVKQEYNLSFQNNDMKFLHSMLENCQ